ncbi:UNVERIFIED_CONTAM: hypothetical protein HHA_312240 [Hammondia hammondi]|eukprot:XP_008885801.1 hypothetical protein HHA_312240 [Hammondia hammondi]
MQGEKDRDSGGNSTHRSREGWSPDTRHERVSPVPEAFCFSDSSPHLHCHACHPQRQREERAALSPQRRLDVFHHKNPTFKIPLPASSVNPSSRVSASQVPAAPSPASTSAYVYSTRLDGCLACSPRARREQYEEDLKLKGRNVPRTRAREIRDACAKVEREETVRRRERERTLREKKEKEHADVSGSRKRQETPDTRGRDQNSSVCPEGRRQQRRSPTGAAAATAHEREDSAWIRTGFVYEQENEDGVETRFGNSAPLSGSDKICPDQYRREARLRSASSRGEVRREETRVPDEERERAEKKVSSSSLDSRRCHKDAREKEDLCRPETGKCASARALEALCFLRKGEGDAGKGSEETSKNAAVSSSIAPRERTHCMQKTTHPRVQPQLCFIPRRLGSAMTARAIHEQGEEKRGGRCEETLESLEQAERRNPRTTALRQTAGPRAASRSGRRPLISVEKTKHSPLRGMTESVCRLDGSNSVDPRSVSPRRLRWERGKHDREQRARNKWQREAGEDAESQANAELDRKQAEAVSRAIQSPVSVNVVEKNAKKLLQSMQRELGHRAPSLLPVQAKLQQLVEGDRAAGKCKPGLTLLPRNRTAVAWQASPSSSEKRQAEEKA